MTSHSEADALALAGVCFTGFLILLVLRLIPRVALRSKAREAFLWLSAPFMFCVAAGGIDILPNDGTLHHLIDDGGVVAWGAWLIVCSWRERQSRSKPPQAASSRASGDTAPATPAVPTSTTTHSDAAVGLDSVLFHWSDKDPFTVRHACENVICSGGTGSGKTSGSGDHLSLSYLRAGFGGMVLSVKDEKAHWEALCRKAGREKDLIVWGPDSPELTFNFLDAEMQRASKGGGHTENVVQMCCHVMEAVTRGNDGGGGREDGSFWMNSMRQMLRAVIDLLRAAGRPITMRNILQVIVTAPKTREELRSEQWMSSSLCFQCLADGQKRARAEGQAEDFESIQDYWCDTFAGLGDKTRASIIVTFTSMADALSRGLLKRLLCTDTTLTPDVMEDGKIVLCNLPVHQFGNVGLIGQHIMKYCFFQRGMERRDLTRNQRPVFLFSDECQYFVTSYDALFLSTCRSSRIATTYLTQNITGLYAAMGGGSKAQFEANSMLGNFGTKIMHANSCHITTEWQANLIGRRITPMMSGSSTRDNRDSIMASLGFGHAGGASAGFAEQFQYELEPAEFSRLMTGGPANNNVVQAIVFQNGRLFQASWRSWLCVDFKQEA